MTLVYAVPIAAWLAYIYAQRHYGDRPTTPTWWALMSGIGTFECAKGLMALWLAPEVTLVVALATGMFTAGVVGVISERNSLHELAEESDGTAAHAA